MQKLDLFPTTVWTNRHPDWSRVKDLILPWLRDESNYITAGKKNGLLITDANLHKNPLFDDVTSFIRSSVSRAMIQMGHKPDHVITSMWATKQERGGHHHLHNHKNTFLAGAMYIDFEGMRPSGTTFVNPTSECWQLEPAYHGMHAPMLEAGKTFPFEEGTLNVFPGWLQHYTTPSIADHRIVIAVNTMPVGSSNKDHFDRYEFPSEMNLHEIEKEVFSMK